MLIRSIIVALAGNVLRLGEGYEALALCGWSSLRQTAVIRCIIFFCAWAINKFINYEIRLNNKQS